MYIELNRKWSRICVLICYWQRKSMVMGWKKWGINVWAIKWCGFGCVCIDISSNKCAQYFNVNLYKTPFKSLASHTHTHTYLQPTLASNGMFSAASAYKLPNCLFMFKNTVQHLIQTVSWYEIISLQTHQYRNEGRMHFAFILAAWKRERSYAQLQNCAKTPQWLHIFSSQTTCLPHFFPFICK